jgi:undecaprenyl-diphosphatase
MRWSVCGLITLAFFIALGVVVAGRPPLAVDLEAAGLWFGRGTEAAWWLTQSGYGLALGAIGLLALGAAIGLRKEVSGVVVTLIAQGFSQAAAAWFKTLFARPRPPHWLMHHESGFSYPSGHAVTAVVFYGGLAAVAANSPLPLGVRRLVVFALTGWAIGIAWSRVALGAHYVTDVVGGLLFGATWFCLVRAIESARTARRAGVART